MAVNLSPSPDNDKYLSSKTRLAHCRYVYIWCEILLLVDVVSSALFYVERLVVSPPRISSFSLLSPSPVSPSTCSGESLLEPNFQWRPYSSSEGL